jgi:hypothetical protein
LRAEIRAHPIGEAVEFAPVRSGKSNGEGFLKSTKKQIPRRAKALLGMTSKSKNKKRKEERQNKKGE